MKYSFPFLILLFAFHAKVSAQNYFLLIGSYTDGSTAKGIHVYNMDGRTGKVALLDSADADNPSYLTFGPKLSTLYSVNENQPGKGLVSAYRFDKKSGKITLLNQQPTVGDGPCYIATDKKGRNVLVANYGSGSLNLFKTNVDGSLLPIAQSFQYEGSGPNKNQEKAHAHGAFLSPDEKYLFVPDLGSDKVYKYKFEGKKAQPVTVDGIPFYKVATGLGPRHIAFSKNGKYLFLLNELEGKVIVYGYLNGNLQELQTIVSTDIPSPDNDKGSAAIRVSPDGKFLYTSNRGQTNNIRIFHIADTGLLTFVADQKVKLHPRDFVITPNGRFLVVGAKNSHTVEIFSVDAETGLLTKTENEIHIANPAGFIIVSR